MLGSVCLSLVLVWSPAQLLWLWGMSLVCKKELKLLMLPVFTLCQIIIEESGSWTGLSTFPSDHSLDLGWGSNALAKVRTELSIALPQMLSDHGTGFSAQGSGCFLYDCRTGRGGVFAGFDPQDVTASCVLCRELSDQLLEMLYTVLRN